MSEILLRIELIEELAKYAHEAWSGWMKYMFEKGMLTPAGELLISPELTARWHGQMNTVYKDLPEEMKPSDREEAVKMLNIMQKRQ